VSYSRAWCVGERKDALQRLIGLYKFERVRSAYLVLGDLLVAVLPDLPDDVVVVPVPTVPSHIRQRGYDHTLLLARRLARSKHLKLSKVLIRATDTMQRHTGASQRRSQAERAFIAGQTLDKNTTYLLVDDVVTTGATVNYAAKVLKNAGAGDVWVVAIARQTLD